jgi:hypothetical protein
MKRTIFIAAFMMAANGLFAQNCSELFFSEYLEGSGNNKGMEIYNPTDQVINLNSYYLARYSNGSNTYTNGGITQLEGFLQPYKTHLIVNGQTVDSDASPASDPRLRALAQQLDGPYPAPTYMNGNDAMALFRDNGGNGDVADFVLVDLFGIIGGGMPADGAGWAAFTDEWVYKNIYEGDEIVGRDSTFIENYIVPDGYWWLPWSSNHALVRKPSVMKGITAATMPTEEFNVTLEWDTVRGGVDVWDSLNAHYCFCEFGTDIGIDEIIESFSMFPNPSLSTVRISYDEGIDRITVFDLSGKQILRSKNLRGVRQEELHIDHLNKGIYMVRIESGNKLLTRKLVKN